MHRCFSSVNNVKNSNTGCAIPRVRDAWGVAVHVLRCLCIVQSFRPASVVPLRRVFRTKTLYCVYKCGVQRADATNEEWLVAVRYVRFCLLELLGSDRWSS